MQVLPKLGRQPPLKLVLIENPDVSGSLNHLGVEVESTAEVVMANNRLKQVALEPEPEEQVTCCYALQDKVWVHDPDGAPWEIYTVLADATVRDLKPAEAVTVPAMKNSDKDAANLILP